MFLIMGNAGCISSTVSRLGFRVPVRGYLNGPRGLRVWGSMSLDTVDDINPAFR